MWYSSIKVGITEIDMEHSNIDTMLQLYFSGRIPETYLEQILGSLIKHFEHEEEIIAALGHDFPLDHQQEHLRLTQQLKTMTADWKKGVIPGKKLAEDVRSILLLHVTEFDVALNPHPPE